MVRTCVTWDVLLVLLNPPQDLTSCRAGARPGHPISGQTHAPQQTIQLSDRMVGYREFRRHFDAERCSRLQVDRGLEIGRLRERKLGWLLASRMRFVWTLNLDPHPMAAPCRPV